MSASTPPGDALNSEQATTDRGSAGSLAAVHLWQIQGVRDVLLIVFVLALVWFGYWLRDVTVPLLIALALAYLFEPLVRRLTKFRGITRTGAVTIILLTFGVSLTVAITLTAPFAIGQTVSLVNRLRTGDYAGLGQRVIEYLPEQYRDDLRTAIEWLPTDGSGGAEAGGKAKLKSNAEGDLGPKAGSDVGPDSGANGAPDPEIGSGRDATNADASAERTPGAASNGRITEGTRSFVVGPDGSITSEPDPAEVKAREAERIRAAVRAELEALGMFPVADSPDTPLVEDAASLGSGAPSLQILGALGSTAERMTGLFLAIVQYSLILFLIPFYFWFFSVSYPSILEFGRSLLPRKNREETLHLIGLMDRAVSGFVRGRIVICAIMGLLFAIGWLICGVPYAITIGLFVGAISLVPYLGGIGLPLAVGLLFFDQLQLAPEARMAWWGMILWPTLVFVVVQSIEGYVLTPLIAGKATDLDPVTIVVAIIAGGSVAGVYGMLLAIPFAACAKILVKHLVLPRVRAWSRGEASDPLPINP
jgi:predicted PurR-regulated permease PerM